MRVITYLTTSCALILIGANFTVSLAFKVNPTIIRSIKGDPDFGNACAFSLPSQADIFVAGKTTEKLGAAMNIDGKEVLLQFVSAQSTKAGKPISANYAKNNIKVRVDFTKIASPKTETSLYLAPAFLHVILIAKSITALIPA